MAMEVKRRGAGQKGRRQLPRQRLESWQAVAPLVELAMHVIDPLNITLHPWKLSWLCLPERAVANMYHLVKSLYLHATSKEGTTRRSEPWRFDFGWRDHNRVLDSPSWTR
jgi:hypothetical protein